MNKRFAQLLAVVSATVAGLAMFACTAYASSPAHTSLVGTWHNVDKHTRSIVKIIIADDGAGGITVHGFGACEPTPCDWGAVPGVVYSDSVSDSEGKYFTAIYHFGFETTILTGRVKPNGLLVVHSYTQFTDGSSRYNYSTANDFIK
jgi:hypothetical protein